MKNKIITVTGPVAAGKTTFSRYLSEIIGAYIIDLDYLAKELYREPAVARFLKREIEPQAFTLEGEILSGVLFRAIFSQQDKREKLEKFVYPILKRKVKEIVSINREAAPFFIVEGVKLKEASIYEIADLKVAVLTTRESQWQRLKNRNFPTYKIQYLLNAQKKKFEYITEVDIVVYNISGLNKLKNEAIRISQAI